MNPAHGAHVMAGLNASSPMQEARDRVEADVGLILQPVAGEIPFTCDGEQFITHHVNVVARAYALGAEGCYLLQAHGVR